MSFRDRNWRVVSEENSTAGWRADGDENVRGEQEKSTWRDTICSEGNCDAGLDRFVGGKSGDLTWHLESVAIFNVQTIVAQATMTKKKKAWNSYLTSAHSQDVVARISSKISLFLHSMLALFFTWITLDIPEDISDTVERRLLEWTCDRVFVFIGLKHAVLVCWRVFVFLLMIKTLVQRATSTICCCVGLSVSDENDFLCRYATDAEMHSIWSSKRVGVFAAAKGRKDEWFLMETRTFRL